MFGQDLYPTYFEKVTALCFSLLKSHGFNDGNKRTALEVTKAMLIKKGYEEILASDEFLMDTMRLTATGDLDKEELLLRLREACGL